MGDYTIKAAFEIDATRSEVMRWLDSTEGIAGWWSDGVTGEAGAAGDHFTVAFPDSPAPFELEVAVGDAETVEWHIPVNPPWWKGTTIGFDLGEGDAGKTTLLFTHRGFDADDPIIQVITPAWVRFLDNLVAVAESGKASPAVSN